MFIILNNRHRKINIGKNIKMRVNEFTSVFYFIPCF